MTPMPEPGQKITVATSPATAAALAVRIGNTVVCIFICRILTGYALSAQVLRRMY